MVKEGYQWSLVDEFWLVLMFLDGYISDGKVLWRLFDS